MPINEALIEPSDRSAHSPGAASRNAGRVGRSGDRAGRSFDTPSPDSGRVGRFEISPGFLRSPLAAPMGRRRALTSGGPPQPATRAHRRGRRWLHRSSRALRNPAAPNAGDLAKSEDRVERYFGAPSRHGDGVGTFHARGEHFFETPVPNDEGVVPLTLRTPATPPPVPSQTSPRCSWLRQVAASHHIHRGLSCTLARLSAWLRPPKFPKSRSFSDGLCGGTW